MLKRLLGNPVSCALRRHLVAVLALVALAVPGWAATSLSTTSFSAGVLEDASQTYLGFITSTLTPPVFGSSTQNAWYVYAQPTGGTAQVSGDTGTVFWSSTASYRCNIYFTPAANWSGSTSFYVACPTTDGIFYCLVSVTVTNVNDPPTFTLNQTSHACNEDGGAQAVANVAGGFNAGGAGFETQSLSGYIVTADRPELFQVQPAISTAGQLTYTPAVNRNGTATLTIKAKDTGGTANGGNDVSAGQSFTVTINPVADSIIFVAPTALGAGNGTSWANASALQEALTYGAGDTLWVQGGTYRPTSGTDRTIAFVLAPGISIYGGFAGWETQRNQRDWRANPTILSGDIGTFGTATDNSFRVILGAADATLDGVVIRDGRADGTSPFNNGGGVVTQGNAMTMRNCRITANYASQFGAGVFVSGATNSSLLIEGSVFDNNTCAYLGGAFMSYLGTANHTIRNCVFAINSATTYGGAFYTENPGTWMNCTFFGNASVNGNLTCYGGGAQTLQNCVVWGNTGTNPALFGSGTFNVSYSTVQGGYTGTGNLSTDPQFSSTTDPDGADNRWATGDDGLIPQAGSSAVNAGSSTGAPAVDVRGAPRTTTAVDMGAYERNARWYIDVNGTGDGTSWGNALANLGAACAVAGAGDDLWVKAGTYKPTAGTDVNATFLIPANGGLWGGFAGTETLRVQRNPAVNRVILSGDIGSVGTVTDNSQHVVTGSAGGTLDGVVVTGGYATTGGYSNLGGGGGIYIPNANNFTVSGCVVTANASSYSGNGIGVVDSAGVSITNTVFSGNVPTVGAGLTWGTALKAYGASVATSVTMTNCTVAAHSPTVSLYGLVATFASASVAINNSIIYGNAGTSVSNSPFYGDGTGITVTNSIVQAPTGGGNYGTVTLSGTSTSDPLCTNLANPIGPDNLWFTDDDGAMPGFGGPAVNVSGLTGVPQTDILGRSRPLMSLSDLGAYEVPNAVTITASDPNASEAGLDPGVFTISRSGPTTVPQRVVVTVSGSSTAAATDYSMPTSVTIPVGSASTTLTVTPIDDLVREDAETVVAQLTNGSAATVTITSDDVVGVIVSTASMSVDESGTTSGTFTVRLKSQPTAPVTIGLASGNTAEYSVSPASLTFLADGTALTDQVVTVTSVNDDLDDGNQTSNLTFVVTSSDANYNGRTVQPVAVTTVDNDVRGLSITPTTLSVTEGGTSATISVALATQPFNLGLGTTVTVSLASSPSGQLLLSGADPATLTFTPANWKTAQTVTVAAVNDDLDETSTTAITVSLTASGADYGSVTGSAAVNVIDDDATPTLSIGAVSASEGAGTAAATITMTGKSAGTVSVPYGMVTGTATNGTTTLSTAVTSSSSSMTVANATGITAGMVVSMEAELALVTQVAGNVLTITRGHQSTTGASHAQGITVGFGDFATASGTLVWTPGQTGAKTFSIPIAADTLNEANETASVGFSGVSISGGFPLPTPASASAVFTIIDDDPVPTVRFTTVGGTSLPSQTVAEGDSGTTTRTVYATISAVSGRTVSIPFSISGTATAGTDFTCTASPLTIAPGATQAAIQIQVQGDAINEVDETVVLSLGTPTGAVASGTTTHTLTITDNDAVPTLQMSASPSTIPENGSATFTVTKSHASEQVVTAQVTISGTADQGADYTLSATSVTIPAGALTGSIVLTGVGDVLDEADDETATLTLVNPTNATLGATTAATVTLQDDDAPPSVSLETAKSVSEAAGGTTVTVTLNAVSGRAVTVPFVVMGTSTATTGTDFTISASPLVIPPGSTSSTIVISLANDDFDEDDEYLKIAFGDGTNGAAAPTNATVSGTYHVLTITDDDATPMLAAGTASLTEPAGFGSGTLSIPVTLTGKSSKTVTVNFATSDGTATAGSDYTAISGTLSWNPGENGVKFVDVTVAGDGSAEGDETILVTLSGQVHAGVSAATGTGTIIDDDQPGLKISAFTVGVTEGDSVGTTFSVALNTIPAAYPTITITADSLTEVSLDGTTWASTVNYLTVNPGTGDVPVHVRGKDNDTYQSSFTGSVTVETPASFPGDTDYQALSATISVVIANDDSAPQIAFTAGTASMTESGTVDLTVELDRLSAFPTTVSYATVSGTAQAGDDFSALAGSLTIPAMTLTATAPITLSAINDTQDEADETFTLVLSGPVNGSLGATTTATITITDNDAPPAVGFLASSAGVAESVGSITATVQLSVASGRDVTVDYTVAGTATGGLDHLLNDGSVSIPAGATSATITVPVVDDAVVENAETIVLTLANPVNATIGAAAAETITLNDNDVGSIVLSNTSGASVTEGSSSTTYGVALGAAPAANVTVTISAASQIVIDTDAATAGNQGTLTFTPANWSQPQMVSVSALDDALQEASPQAITVSHGVTGGLAAYVGITPVDFTIDVIDNDVAGVVVATSQSLSTSESDTTVSNSGVAVSLQLSSQPTHAVTLPVSLVSVGSFTASAEIDMSAYGTTGPVTAVVFTPTSGEAVTLSGGILSGGFDMPHQLTFLGVDDQLDDGNRQVNLTFGTITSSDSIYTNTSLVSVPAQVTLTNRDDDTAGMVVTPLNGLTTTEAGGVALFTVRLQAQPKANVTLSISSTDVSEGVVDRSSLVFTTSNYQVPQLVIVTGQDDEEADGNLPYKALVGQTVTSTDAAYAALNLQSVSITNLDNDVAGVVLSTTTLSIHETSSAGNHSASYTVRLASRPTGTVTVAVNAGSQATANVASLVFNASDWSTPQTVTVTAVDDLVAEADPHVGTVVHSVSSSDPLDAYASLTAGTVALSITDNDQANVAILNSSGGSPLGTLTVNESGSTALFGVVLGSKPTANVVVVLSSSDPTEGTVSPSSVAFSTSDWDQLKLVKVTGVDDRIHDGDVTWQVVTAEALSSDQAYNNFNPSDVQVQTTDDDTPALATNLLGQLGTTEAGGTAVFQVALTTQPAAGSTVTVHPTSSDGAEIGVSADLIFTPANWNTYQNIVLTGLDDAVDDDAQTVTITLSVVTTSGARDQDYDGLTATVTATNQDDDVPAILVSATTGLSTSETGGTASFQVSLSCQPTANVTVDTAASDSSEGRIPYDRLVFTTITDQALSIVGRTATAGWNVPIQVVATGVDDVVVDGTQSWTVTLAQAVSADPAFAAINPADVTVTNADDEIPMSATPSSLTLTEGGGDGTVTLMLLGTPTSPVTVSLSLSDFSQASLSATSVTFTAANVPQTVTITPVADGSADGPAALTLIIGAATSTDLTFDGYDLTDIPITIADQDATAVRIAATTGLVTAEDGTTATTTVTLGSRPTADVVVTFTSSIPGEILPSPATMTFTTTTWNVPQDLTLTGQDDAVADGAVPVNVAVAVTSADTGYDGLSVAALQASNLDDDQPAILVLPSGGSTRVAEAGTADEVAVRLASQPTGTVVVTVDPGSQLTASPASLTFTTSNWNTAQTVLVRAVDDAVVEGSHTGDLTLSAAGGTYDAVTATSPVQVADNDQAGIQVSPTSGIVTTEAGGTGAFTVSLTSKPAADVTIAITSSDTAEISTSVASLTFTTLDYATPRIVTLTGVQDAEDDGDQTVTITLAPAVSTDTNYAGLNPADVTATNRDDDTAAIVAIPGTGLLTDEGGGTATFTVTLASQPTSPVTVAVSSTNGAEAAASPATLTFDSTSWSTPQTVTVTGQDDAIADGDASFAINLQATSSDGAYQLVTATLSGLNQDNDTPGLLVTLPDGPLVLDEAAPTVGRRIGIALRTTPASAVTVDLTGLVGQLVADVPQVVLSTTTVQYITLKPVQDAIAEGASMNVPLTITASSADSAYQYDATTNPDLRNQGIVASIQDDDLPGITVSPLSGLTTTEAGGTATFTVVLNAQPQSNVTIALSSSDTTQGTVSPASVTFLPGVWNVPQTVTVTGADTNGQEDGDVGYRIITAPATTASIQDPYSGIDAPDVLVVNQVVDNPPTMDQPVALAINEDAALQTIALMGITSGQASEVQSLVVTAVSGDPSLTGPLQVAYVDRATTGSVTFTPPNNAHGASTISIAVSDGTTTTTRTVTVTIAAINDLPVVSRNQPLTVNLRGTGALRGAQSLVGDANQLAATDVETAGAALVFRVMLVPGGGVLKVDGATVENDGSFTQAQLEAGLVTYTHAGGGGSTDGFTFKVEDGDGGASSPNVFRIIIDRRAPDVALAPTVPGTLTYTENDAPLLLADQSTVADADNTSFNGAQLRLAITSGAGAGDVLQVLPRTTGVGVLTVASGSIFIDGVAVATLSGGTGGADLVVTGALVATPVHFQAIVQCLAYANASEVPDAGTRTLALTITDPDATVAGPLALRPVTVVTVNDAPVLTAATFVTATGRAFDGTITATDPDGPAITFGLATPAVKGTVSLTPSTGAFTYTPAAGLSGIDTFVVSATDGLTPAVPLTVTVRITGRGATVRPWITSDPPTEVQAGDLLRFTVAVDPRELPVGYNLSFSADGAPSGMVITKDGPASAVVTWTAVAGTANHLLFTITATDATSGSMATLPVTLFVQPAATGGG